MCRGESSGHRQSYEGPAKSIPTIAFSAGNNTRSRSLRLRSPRDSAVPLLTDVLLDSWDTKSDRPHQEDVSTSSTDTLNALLACTRPRTPRERDTGPQLSTAAKDGTRTPEEHK